MIFCADHLLLWPVSHQMRQGVFRPTAEHYNCKSHLEAHICSLTLGFTERRSLAVLSEGALGQTDGSMSQTTAQRPSMDLSRVCGSNSPSASAQHVKPAPHVPSNMITRTKHFSLRIPIQVLRSRETQFRGPAHHHPGPLTWDVCESEESDLRRTTLTPVFCGIVYNLAVTLHFYMS